MAVLGPANVAPSEVVVRDGGRRRLSGESAEGDDRNHRPDLFNEPTNIHFLGLLVEIYARLGRFLQLFSVACSDWPQDPLKLSYQTAQGGEQMLSCGSEDSAWCSR
jgi:hypothetical protein